MSSKISLRRSSEVLIVGLCLNTSATALRLSSLKAMYNSGNHQDKATSTFRGTIDDNATMTIRLKYRPQTTYAIIPMNCRKALADSNILQHTPADAVMYEMNHIKRKLQYEKPNDTKLSFIQPFTPFNFSTMY